MKTMWLIGFSLSSQLHYKCSILWHIFSFCDTQYEWKMRDMWVLRIKPLLSVLKSLKNDKISLIKSYTSAEIKNSTKTIEDKQV